MNRSSKSLVPIIALSFAVLLVAALSWKIISAPDDLASDQAAQDQNPAPRLGKAAPPVIWKNTAPAERSAAVASIRGQLDACKNGQWHKAVSYQSTNLKRSFDSTDAFRSMIEGSYPHFANFKSVKFGAARSLGARVEIVVELTGNDGTKVSALYRMIKEKAGYRVDGVSGGQPKSRPAPSDDDFA